MTVYLYDKLVVETDKINNIVFDDVLSSEFMTKCFTF